MCQAWERRTYKRHRPCLKGTQSKEVHKKPDMLDAITEPPEMYQEADRTLLIMPGAEGGAGSGKPHLNWVCMDAWAAAR